MVLIANHAFPKERSEKLTSECGSRKICWPNGQSKMKEMYFKRVKKPPSVFLRLLAIHHTVPTAFCFPTIGQIVVWYDRHFVKLGRPWKYARLKAAWRLPQPIYVETILENWSGQCAPSKINNITRAWQEKYCADKTGQSLVKQTEAVFMYQAKSELPT